MWHLTKIPQHAYFFWANDKLPWLRYLTLFTFRAHNPDWKMTIYTRKDPTKTNLKVADDYWPFVQKLGIVVEAMSFEEYNNLDLSAVDDLSVRDVVRSDLLRWYLLCETGGLWADMDILHMRPLDKALWNCYDNREVTMIGMPTPYNNFLLSAPNSDCIVKLWETARTITPEDINKDPFSTGPVLYERVCKDQMFTGYVVIPEQTTEVADRSGYDFSSEGKTYSLAVDTIGVHWHGSGLVEKYLNINFDTYKKDRTLLGQVVNCALD